MSKIRVGVIRGGPSSEYEVSLNTGSNVLKTLSEKYIPIDILITKDGVWHIDGMPVKLAIVAKKVDVVFNALHGEYGEDGKVQQALENYTISYTGSGVLGSAVGFNKELSKKVYSLHKIKTPHHIIISREENESLNHKNIIETFRRISIPVVVKPVAAGSSVGVSIAENFYEFEEAIFKAFKISEKALIEEYINGREATCGVINNFRGEKIYSLLPVEIIKPDNSKFFDYEAKYNGASKEICPGKFLNETKEVIQEMAKNAHKALGLCHYSRSDFIIHPKRGVYILETNTLPGLTSESLFPKSLYAIGVKMPDFLDHLITLALEE